MTFWITFIKWNVIKNKPVYQGDVIVFENGLSAAQSVDEATVKGQKTNSRSADLTLLAPGSFFFGFRFLYYPKVRAFADTACLQRPGHLFKGAIGD